MQTVLNIPKVAGEPLVLNLSPGNPIFVVGPNGSGKSALIQHAVMSLGSVDIWTWVQLPHGEYNHTFRPMGEDFAIPAGLP